jgi:transposase-like protein
MQGEKFPETLQEAIGYFSNPDKAFELMVSKRWPNGVYRPRCESKEVRFMATRRVWNCNGCRKQFSVKVGTNFEDSPIDLGKWLSAFWLITNAKNGISSCELHRTLGVTQKTAWLMLHRIRLAIQNGSIVKIGGQVEVDETYIGGRARMRNAKQKAKRREANPAMKGGWGMTPVQGLLERSTAKKASRVILKVVETTRKGELQGHVRNYVLKGAEVHTDQLLSYEGLADEYTHNVINHAECYVKGHVHTNGLENFWSLLKRAIKGTYVSVEPFHLFRYLDEQAFRFNERKDCDAGRFLKAVGGVVGKRLTYSKLIAENERLPSQA